MLDTYRRPDGSLWTGQKLDEATGGVVPRSYFTNLRRGRIENPGYEKMRAIAKAMGFPPEAWFDETPGHTVAPAEGRDLAGRVESLFDTIVYPNTGEPFTDAEVARMSAGGLMEEVEGSPDTPETFFGSVREGTPKKVSLRPRSACSAYHER